MSAPEEPKKIYYQYINDTVEDNMPPDQVGAMLVRLRRLREESAQSGEHVAVLKRRLRSSDPEVDKFAREHPRMFDNILSAYTNPEDIELMTTMLRLKTAVNRGDITEQFARAMYSDLAIKRNMLPVGTDTEMVCDRRLERKAEEGSFLGFDAKDIPHLKAYADRSGGAHRVVKMEDMTGPQ